MTQKLQAITKIKPAAITINKIKPVMDIKSVAYTARVYAFLTCRIRGSRVHTPNQKSESSEKQHPSRRSSKVICQGKFFRARSACVFRENQAKPQGICRSSRKIQTESDLYSTRDELRCFSANQVTRRVSDGEFCRPHSRFRFPSKRATCSTAHSANGLPIEQERRAIN
jgi:hypothetical protein